MGRIASSIGALCVVVIAWLVPVPAEAKYVYVSASGNDSTGNGSLAKPFRTFQRAHNAANDGDIIQSLQLSFDYGPVKVTKTVSISGGAIVNPGTTAITFNGGPNDTLIVDALTIDHPPGTADDGIRFNSGHKLNVLNTTIRGVTGGASGILFRPNTNSELNVINSNLNGNGTSGQGSAIRVQPRNGADVAGVIKDSFLSNSLTGIRSVSPVGTSLKLLLDHLNITGGGTGIFSSGPGSEVVVNNSSITNNSTGVQSANSGQIRTRVNNILFGNGTDGSFTGSQPPS